MATATRERATQNGRATESNGLAEAIAYEQAIADEAAEIRGGATQIDRALFLKLRPLLRKPIPPGFIQHVGTVSGKPYESDGVSSVQVQIERMDAVLTPFGWWDEVEWLAADGSLAEVTVFVGDAEERTPFFSRTARGGVKQPNPGNTAKGTYTNAAKLAFARVGPAHEVYLGAADFDPDTSTEAAQAAAESGSGPAEQKAATVTGEQAENLRKAVESAGLTDHLPTKLRSFGVKEISELTVEQGLALWDWSQGEGS